jgi:hypothetical protein
MLCHAGLLRMASLGGERFADIGPTAHSGLKANNSQREPSCQRRSSITKMKHSDQNDVVGKARYVSQSPALQG